MRTAEASSVTSLPKVTYNTKYGSLVPLNTISFNSLTLYGNGTFYLNVTSFELSEPDRQLRFSETSYGNGTWQIRVQTSLTPNVLGVLSSQSYASSLLKIDVSYNDAQVRTGTLVIAWGGIGNQTRLGAYFLGLFMFPLLLLVAIWWLNKNTLGGEESSGGTFRRGQHDKDGGQKIFLAALLILALIFVGAVVAISLYGGI